MNIGIIGYGHFGMFVHRLVSRFVSGAQVRVYSSRREPDSITFFPLADVATCDVVVLCVPIHAFETTVEKILPLLGKNSILVDVATVKIHTCEVLKRLVSDRKYIATHPMFGPESYAKKNQSVAGFRIVLTEHTLAQSEYNMLTEFFEQCGFTIVHLSTEQHDQHLAETLFLTHYVGQIITSGDFVRTEIDTISFGYLMDAVESVRNDKELFKDVYKYNPYCKEVLERFARGEKQVHVLLEGN